MGCQHVTLKFEMLWVRPFSILVVNGGSAELIAHNDDTQVKVTLRGVTNHSITGKTHTFQSLIDIDGDAHHGQVTATFKEGTDLEVLYGNIEFDKYPPDNMSE